MNISPMIDIRTLMEEVTKRMVDFNESGLTESALGYTPALEMIVAVLEPLCKGLEDRISLAEILNDDIVKKYQDDLSFYNEMLTKMKAEIDLSKKDAGAA